MGGGTAGLTIAERLAEDPGTTVAVVEAGMSLLEGGFRPKTILSSFQDHYTKSLVLYSLLHRRAMFCSVEVMPKITTHLLTGAFSHSHRPEATEEQHIMPAESVLGEGSKIEYTS